MLVGLNNSSTAAVLADLSYLFYCAVFDEVPSVLVLPKIFNFKTTHQLG